MFQKQKSFYCTYTIPKTIIIPLYIHYSKNNNSHSTEHAVFQNNNNFPTYNKNNHLPVHLTIPKINNHSTVQTIFQKTLIIPMLLQYS